MHEFNIESIEASIAEERKNLDRWLDYEYGVQADRCYNGEVDCSYDRWGAIGTIVGRVFDNEAISRVSEEAVTSILFFISRNEEIGSIIAWLRRTGPLSNVGDLRVPDFFYLCEASLAHPEDFSDYELVNSFHKFPSSDDDQIRLALRFFAREYAYTKRLAIDVLASKNFADVPALAEELWASDDCEFTKLSCLFALKKIEGGRQLVSHYLASFRKLFDVESSDYLPDVLKQLES